MIYDALAAGHCFVGYDLPQFNSWFSFHCPWRRTAGIMGDEIEARGGVTLQAYLPFFAEIRLMKNGKVLQTAQESPGTDLYHTGTGCLSGRSISEIILGKSEDGFSAIRFMSARSVLIVKA